MWESLSPYREEWKSIEGKKFDTQEYNINTNSHQKIDTERWMQANKSISLANTWYIFDNWPMGDVFSVDMAVTLPLPQQKMLRVTGCIGSFTKPLLMWKWSISDTKRPTPTQHHMNPFSKWFDPNPKALPTSKSFWIWFKHVLCSNNL